MKTNRSILTMVAAAAFAFGACQAGASAVPTLPVAIPTFPPDDLASGTAACIDEPTMAIIDQLRATGADVPAILAANKDALLSGPALSPHCKLSKPIRQCRTLAKHKDGVGRSSRSTARRGS